MVMEALGDRMKTYEIDERYGQDEWLILRIDGRSFGTRCKKLQRFDPDLRWAMIWGTMAVAKDIGRPMTLAFTNSDEASFLMCADVGKLTEHWFGGRRTKIASVAASVFTTAFNDAMDWTASFDARVYPIPAKDAPNYFIWRQRDCKRNAVNILSRKHYGTEAVSREKKFALEGEIPTAFLHGTILDRKCKMTTTDECLSYADFAKMIEEQRDADSQE